MDVCVCLVGADGRVVPRSSVAPPEGRRDRQKKKELEKGKTADRKGTVKAVWQKTGMAFKKKKKKQKKTYTYYFFFKPSQQII
jgi:hypothetical protein